MGLPKTEGEHWERILRIGADATDRSERRTGIFIVAGGDLMVFAG
jgi:hypothetical protein